MELVKPKGNKPLGRPRSRWEDNIRIDFDEIGINMGNWVDSTQDRDYWRALENVYLRIDIYFSQLKPETLLNDSKILLVNASLNLLVS